jgi:hypothetical protein
MRKKFPQWDCLFFLRRRKQHRLFGRKFPDELIVCRALAALKALQEPYQQKLANSV